MDIEQLKLILETVGAASEGASTFAAWWLVKEFILSLIGYSLGAYTVYLIGSVIKGIISKIAE